MSDSISSVTERSAKSGKARLSAVDEHVIEIVSDSGEGAQKAAVSFAQVSAKMGNYLYTIEIIPSEIQPPPHTVGSASGNRVRLGSKPMTNGGDLANVVLAFNEMALLSRMNAGSLAKDVIVIIDSVWATHSDPVICKQYREILDSLAKDGARIYEVPMETETLKIISDPIKGKNMFAVGVLSYLYDRDVELMKAMIASTFGKKSKEVQATNIALFEKGYEYGSTIFQEQFYIEAAPFSKPMISINGNQAIALGAIAAGFEICSMYPITPATSASHYLSEIIEEFGGFVHQAEDEISAIGVALGYSYAGKTALTITSGPGMALKTEFMGLTVMTETPLVLVDVQRGGPSTGLPTKVEQADLLAALFGAPGDAPKVIIAPSSIEECFHVMPMARRIAEEFRMLVVVLTDANLATGVQMFEKPVVTEDTLPLPLDLSPAPAGVLPYDWDEKTGLSRRIIPGQPGGTNVTTSLNHASNGRIYYDPDTNQRSHKMRSRKLAVLKSTLTAPAVFGAPEGDLLCVGWGSTRGVIEEAVERMRKAGHRISCVHIQFLSPLPPGLKEIMSKFRKVMTVELNYCDDPADPYIDSESRRYSQLAQILRAHTLVDIDCYGRVPGRPLMPMELVAALSAHIEALKTGK